MYLQKKSRVLLIDASRNRSGGAVIYLKKFFENFDPTISIFTKIIIFSYKDLLNELPKKKYLIKCQHPFLEKNLFFQIFWQIYILPKYIYKNKIDLLFTTDTSSFCFHNPSIILNQDILGFDKLSMNMIPISWEKIRLYAIRYIQIFAMNKANKVIFVSNYSKDIISKFLKKNISSTVIYHGIDNNLKVKNDVEWNINSKKKIKLVYVSPVLPYKNHLTVVKAYSKIREMYKNVEIKFIGAYDPTAKVFKNLFEKSKDIKKDDFLGDIHHSEVIKEIYKSDIFIFASSSETFGISLVEAMSIGIPIICSNKSSLPEILRDGGIYFDPFSEIDLIKKIKYLFHNPKIRSKISKKSLSLCKNYNWNENFRKFNNLTKEVLL